MNKEEKKAFEELSKKAVLCNYEERDYPNMICFKKDMLIVLNLIEKLQKENEKLKKEIERQKDINTVINEKGLDKNYEKALEKTMTKFLKNNIANDFISKQTVKDKIEELNSRIEIYRKYEEQGIETNVEWVDNVADRETVKVLQELIEEREKK